MSLAEEGKVPREITHRELDEMIAALGDNAERFDEALVELVERVDRAGHDLEILETGCWRRPIANSTRCSFTRQFRADVNSILVMKRDQELRLAKRIQFSRLRLERAAATVGMSPDERDRLLLSTAYPSTTVERRACELQRMRIELVERNLYLVLINVERYAKRGGSREDLIQEGCIALFKAVDRFDWKRGLLFRTYAVHWLNQAFRSYLYNHSNTVRVPVYLQKVLKHINQATIRIGKENASAEELAAYSNLAPGLVRSALAAARSSFSMDSAAEGDKSSRLRETIVDERSDWGHSARLESVSLQEGLNRAMGELRERDRNVLEMRFGIGHQKESTLAEVAEIYGISLERVRQIQARALGHLDTARLRREMDPYLN